MAALLLLLLGLLRAVDAYSVVDCEVVLTSADTNPATGSTNVLYIDSKEKLDALEASVAHCADGWRVKGGGLWLLGVGDVADLEALSGLVGIDGMDSRGDSLVIDGNANLDSLAGLRNLKGTLPGGLHVG